MLSGAYQRRQKGGGSDQVIEELLESKTVSELRSLEKQTRNEANAQSGELKQLVGGSAAELIGSADSIHGLGDSARALVNTLDELNRAKQRLRGPSEEKGDTIHQSESKNDKATLYEAGSRVKLVIDSPDEISAQIEGGDPFDAANSAVAAIEASSSLRKSPRLSRYAHRFPLLKRYTQRVDSSLAGIESAAIATLSRGCEHLSEHSRAAAALALIGGETDILTSVLKCRTDAIAHELSQARDNNKGVRECIQNAIGAFHTSMLLVQQLLTDHDGSGGSICSSICNGKGIKDIIGSLPNPQEELQRIDKRANSAIEKARPPSSSSLQATVCEWLDSLHNEISTQCTTCLEGANSLKGVAEAERAAHEACENLQGVCEQGIDSESWRRICAETAGRHVDAASAVIGRPLLERSKQLIEGAAKAINLKDRLEARIEQEASRQKQGSCTTTPKPVHLNVWSMPAGETGTPSFADEVHQELHSIRVDATFAIEAASKGTSSVTGNKSALGRVLHDTLAEGMDRLVEDASKRVSNIEGKGGAISEEDLLEAVIIGSALSGLAESFEVQRALGPPEEYAMSSAGETDRQDGHQRMQSAAERFRARRKQQAQQKEQEQSNRSANQADRRVSDLSTTAARAHEIWASGTAAKVNENLSLRLAHEATLRAANAPGSWGSVAVGDEKQDENEAAEAETTEGNRANDEGFELRLPVSPSGWVHDLLFAGAKELESKLGARPPRKSPQMLARCIAKGLLHAIESHTGLDMPEGLRPPLGDKMTDIGATQLIFDVRSACEALGRHEAERAESLVGHLAECLDPIDWATADGHIQRLAERFATSSSALFGELSSSAMVNSGDSSGHAGMGTSLLNVDTSAINHSSSLRFSYLPVSNPGTQRGSRQAKEADTAGEPTAAVISSMTDAMAAVGSFGDLLGSKALNQLTGRRSFSRGE